MSERPTFRTAVYLLLVKDDLVLLSRRFNTGYEDGKYSLIAGHHDGETTLIETMIREAYEETGILLKSGDMQIVHMMHTNSNKEYFDFFITANSWEGEPSIMEKDKCDDLAWFNINELPENLVPSVRQGIKNYQENIYFSEYGFEK